MLSAASAVAAWCGGKQLPGEELPCGVRGQSPLCGWTAGRGPALARAAGSRSLIKQAQGRGEGLLCRTQHRHVKTPGPDPASSLALGCHSLTASLVARLPKQVHVHGGSTQRCPTGTQLPEGPAPPCPRALGRQMSKGGMAAFSCVSRALGPAQPGTALWAMESSPMPSMKAG